MRGWRMTSTSRSGNCRSTACTTRVAVSPVASETTCSSTGSIIPRSVAALARDLGQVADRAEDVANVEEEPEAVGTDTLVLRHDEHLVEEAVDRSAQLACRVDRAREVSDLDAIRDAWPGVRETRDERLLGRLGEELAANGRACSIGTTREPTRTLVRGVCACERLGVDRLRERLGESCDGAELLDGRPVGDLRALVGKERCIAPDERREIDLEPRLDGQATEADGRPAQAVGVA